MCFILFTNETKKKTTINLYIVHYNLLHLLWTNNLHFKLILQLLEIKSIVAKKYILKIL